VESLYSIPFFLFSYSTDFFSKTIAFKEKHGIIEKEKGVAMEEKVGCMVCPHRCKVQRENGERGRCGAPNDIKIARVGLHLYEEPCISGENGSGTVFFSHCNLSCLYCQNYPISAKGIGEEISIEELACMFLYLQRKGAHNINLVTPTMYAYGIKQALQIAKRKGLHIPIIYNTNGYESIETLRALEGYIDIYLPDLKYASEEMGKKYSKVSHYFETATKAILEMYRQVGNPQFDEQGMIQKGMIVRHLVLPGHLQNTRKILQWIQQNLPKEVMVSVMAQYFPTYLAVKDPYLSRKVTKKEYKKVEEWVFSMGIENGYLQELEEKEGTYVPDFGKEQLENVRKQIREEKEGMLLPNL